MHGLQRGISFLMLEVQCTGSIQIYSSDKDHYFVWKMR